ncbi:MAG: tetratricopeptide repeat protein [Actinobacteria bacterium]|nr:tetratricopeptide repeat protein [Actinomycetota bacterium]
MVLVVAISLLARVWADDPSEITLELEGPLVSAVTGTTDRLTPTEASTDPAMTLAPGRVQPSRQEWEALLPRVQAVVDENPGDVNALRKLALAHYNLGRLDEAAALYEELLAIEEDSVLRNRLGNTLRDMGDSAGAEAAYRKAIADDPAIAPHYLNLAELLWRQGRNQEALTVLNEGLESVPEEQRAALEEGRRVLEKTTD